MNKYFLWTLGAIVVFVVGFFAFNSYIYNEKQGEGAPQENIQEEQENTQPIVGENLEGEADPSRMTLDMNTWVWIRAEYNDGRVVKPLKEGAFTLKFSGDTFSAKTDCNGVGGEYDASQGKISFNRMMSTLMYCEGSQEAVFAELLANSSGYHFTSRGELVLSLKFDSGTVTFR